MIAIQGSKPYPVAMLLRVVAQFEVNQPAVCLGKPLMDTLSTSTKLRTGFTSVLGGIWDS